MRLICDKCGQEREQQMGIKIGNQKICVKCLAQIMVDLMPMPELEISKNDLQSRIEQIEEKLKGIENDKSDRDDRN
jgi:hypothetical protein